MIKVNKIPQVSSPDSTMHGASWSNFAKPSLEQVQQNAHPKKSVSVLSSYSLGNTVCICLVTIDYIHTYVFVYVCVWVCIYVQKLWCRLLFLDNTLSAKKEGSFFAASVSLEHMAHGEIQFQTQKRALGNQLAPEPHFIGEIQPINITTFSSVTSLCRTDKMAY